ncbi:MAG: hypothetical protein IJP92_15775 [Lachnospiraceae bacterium]|nr:hypothetical protein [Lachnospiraceae bacterium]
MRKTTYLSRAVSYGILLIAALILIALYPLRLFRREVELSSGGAASDTVLTANAASFVTQHFRPEFNKIAAIEVYVEALDAGRYMEVHVNDTYAWERAYRVIDLATEKIPGWVRIPLGVSIPVGNPENLLINGRRATFRLQAETVTAESRVTYQGLYGAEGLQEGLRLRMRVIYDLPVNGRTTLFAGVMTLLAALLLIAAVHGFFRRFESLNRLIVVRDAWKRVAQASAAVFFAFLFFLNYPLKAFDDHAGEILFYGIGIVLAAVSVFYLIHRLFGDLSLVIRPLWRSWLMSILFAFAIEHACDYANGFYDINHYIAARQMAVCMLLMLIVAAFPHHVFHPVSIAALAGAAAVGLWYVQGHLQPETEQYYEINNKLVRLQAAVMVLAFYVAVLLLLHAGSVLREQKEPFRKIRQSFGRITPYGYLTMAVFACMMLFANTRTWLYTLVILYALLYTGITAFGLRERWFHIFSDGVTLHFFASVLFCLLHRAYQHWMFPRYPFIFTTETVTGQYLVLVLAVATVRMTIKLQKLPSGTSLWESFRAVCLEFFFFGVVSVYLFLTITRLAWLSGLAMFFVALVLAGRHCRLRMAVLACASLLLLFAPVFTMQRALPAIRSDHRYVGGWEELVTPSGIMGDIPTDSPFYMRAGRFFDMIRIRLTGQDPTFRMRRVDPYNYDAEGNLLYGENGEPVAPATGEEEDGESAGKTADVSASDTPEAEEGYDFSSGRRGIWRAYLERMNLTGHELMYIEGEAPYHAHNTYLQAMYDHGVPVGLLFSAWIGITIITGALRYRKSRTEMPYLQTVMSFAFACLGVAEWIFHLGNPATVLFLGTLAPLMTKER